VLFVNVFCIFWNMVLSGLANREAVVKKEE
jgi:hypothetical protein